MGILHLVANNLILLTIFNLNASYTEGAEIIAEQQQQQEQRRQQQHITTPSIVTTKPLLFHLFTAQSDFQSHFIPSFRYFMPRVDFLVASDTQCNTQRTIDKRHTWTPKKKHNNKLLVIVCDSNLWEHTSFCSSQFSVRHINQFRSKSSGKRTQVIVDMRITPVRVLSSSLSHFQFFNSAKWTETNRTDTQIADGEQQEPVEDVNRTNDATRILRQ